jgi:stage II sporulation protein D
VVALLAAALFDDRRAEPASAATPGESTMVTIVGRAFGHGIGMSQWGAYGYATRTSLGYKDILRHYYKGIGFGTTPNRGIRVLLNRGLDAARVTAAATYTAAGLDAGGAKVSKSVPGGRVTVVTWDQSRLRYRLTDGVRVWRWKGPITFRAGSAKLRYVDANQNGSADVRYRGGLTVRREADGLMVVNTLPLERYLYGVVPREMPASWPARALRAQAVAARTYALATLNTGQPFDVYCTTRSQVYDGFDGSGGEQPGSTAAVQATAGVIAVYGGRPITAFFFSTSGGETESIQHAWPGSSPVPYLVGVDDPREPDTGYHSSWPENPIRRTAAQATADLGAYGSGNPDGVEGTLRTIFVTRRGSSPRIVTAYVVGSLGAHAITGPALRAGLRPAAGAPKGLRSTWFTVKTMSIAPSGVSAASIAPGASVVLSGRVYPAATSGLVTLNYFRDGAWASRTVNAVAGSESLPGGASATYSTYAFTASPLETTLYYFSSGQGVSPRATVTVTP